MKDETILNLLEKIKQINYSYDKIAQKTGGNFNIFNVLGLESNEVKHSMLIGDLLNPKGFHGQGTHFLDLFLDQMNENKTPFELDSTSTVVEVEKNIGLINDDKTCGGRLDIYLADKDNNCIIIENKIYATDQEKQLVRYYNYGESLKNENYILIYLNLSGEDPSKYSIQKGNNENDVLVKNKDFTILNYKTFILPWLEKCLAISNHKPYIREILTQYISIINNLTGQPNNPEMSEDIVTKLTESKENLEAAFEIQKHLTEAKIEIQWLFWQDLKNAFIKEGFNISDDNSVDKDDVEKYYKKGEKWYGLSIKNEKLTNKNTYFRVEIEHNIYFGFKTTKNNSSDTITQIKSIHSDYKNNEHWLGWRRYEPLINFKSFNTNEVLNLVNKNKRENTIQNILDKCISDINSFLK